MTESSSERHQQQPRNAGIIYMQGNARWPRHFFFCKHSPHLSFPSPHNGPVSFIFSPSSFLHQRIFQRCLMGHSKRSRFHTGKGRDPTCRLRARASLTHESHFKCSARLLNSHVIRRVAQISLGKKKRRGEIPGINLTITSRFNKSNQKRKKEKRKCVKKNKKTLCGIKKKKKSIAMTWVRT